MTVSNSTYRVSYNGNGSTTSFSIPFYFINNSDLLVTKQNTDGSETAFVFGTDYNLTGAGDLSGGTLTTTATLITNEKITIERDAQFTQSTDYEPFGRFPAETLEQNIDKLTMLSQQVKALTDRVPLLDRTTSYLNSEIEEPSSGEYLRWDASGNIVNGGTDVIDSSNYLLPADNAVTRTVAGKLNDWASVKDFGAVGNGTANDTDAIQNALNSGYAYIYFPQGLYKVNSALTCPNTVRMIAGAGNSTVGTAIYYTGFASTWLLDPDSSSLTIQDIAFYGGDFSFLGLGGGDTAPTTRNGLNLNSAGDRGRFERCTFYGFSIGCYVGEPSALTFMHKFDQCDFVLNTTGAWVSSGTHQTSFINSVFRSNVSFGLKVDPTDIGADLEVVSLGLYNCTFENTSDTVGRDLYLYNCRGVSVDSCYFEIQGRAGVELAGSPGNGCSGISIKNCYIYASGSKVGAQHGVFITSNVRAMSITYNHFEGFDAAGQYPIYSPDYSENYVDISDNIYNNCTGEDYPVAGVLSAQYNNFSYNSGQKYSAIYSTQSTASFSVSNIGKVALANTTSRHFLRVRMYAAPHDSGVAPTDNWELYQFLHSGGAVSVARNTSGTGAFTLSVSNQGTTPSGFTADVNISVTGGIAGSADYKFEIEEVKSNDSGFIPNNFLETTFS